MARIARITWERIKVVKSEHYGPLGTGEPGNSAEWRVYLEVHIDGRHRIWDVWERDEIRDDRSYSVDRQIDFVHDGELSVRFYGHESDTTSGNDKLPELERTHSPEPGWESGGTRYRKSLVGIDFNYEIHYRIEYISEGATLTPAQGTLYDLRYAGLWNASGARTFCSLGRTAAQVNAQAAEAWGEGARLAQLQAYVLGDQVLYNVIWTFSGIRQLWNLDCDEAHFARTTGEAWSWARPQQVIPFVFGGRVRYACFWNEGTHSQRWHPNTDDAGFRAITGETWSWARPHQVYAFVANGEVRYSCLWNAGQHAQLWHPNCSEAEAVKLIGDNWTWGRVHQVQPFGQGRQRRYSLLVDAGRHRQLWNVSCDLRQLDLNSDETSSWARPRQIFAAS